MFSVSERKPAPAFPTLSRMHIPTDASRVFRRKPASDSDGSQPLTPPSLAVDLLQVGIVGQRAQAVRGELVPGGTAGVHDGVVAACDRNSRSSQLQRSAVSEDLSSTLMVLASRCRRLLKPTPGPATCRHPSRPSARHGQRSRRRRGRRVAYKSPFQSWRQGSARAAFEVQVMVPGPSLMRRVGAAGRQGRPSRRAGRGGERPGHRWGADLERRYVGPEAPLELAGVDLVGAVPGEADIRDLLHQA